MDIRLIASAFCGSALTMAVVAFASAPHAQNQCTVDLANINSRFSAIEQSMASVAALSNAVSALQTSSASSAAWQSGVTEKLDRINSNLLEFHYQSTLHH
jgi:ABC-type Fe3+-siderophore transport system permease subunit